jgi:hypothetical protein
MSPAPGTMEAQSWEPNVHDTFRAWAEEQGVMIHTHLVPKKEAQKGMGVYATAAIAVRF